MFNDADVGADSQTSTGAYVERNRPKPPASPYMAPGANVQDFGGYAPDGAQPPPDSPVYGPYSPPGAIQTGNEASDEGVPSPSFAGPGYTGFQGFNPPPTPVPESGNGSVRTPSMDAIQAPTLIGPRRDAMSAIGRALMTSPHAIGRFLGGVLNSGQMNDDAANSQAMEMFRAKIAEANQRGLGEQRQTLMDLREDMAARARAQTEKLENPAPKPHDPDWGYTPTGVAFDRNAATAPPNFTPPPLREGSQAAPKDRIEYMNGVPHFVDRPGVPPVFPPDGPVESGGSSGLGGSTNSVTQAPPADFHKPSAASSAMVSDDDADRIADNVIAGGPPPSAYGQRNAGPIAAAVMRKDPKFNLGASELDWKATGANIRALNSNPQNRVRQALTTVEETVPLIDSLYQEWQTISPNTDYKAANRAQLKLAEQFPGRAGEVASTMNTQINHLISELAQIYQAGGVPTERALKLAENSIDGAWNSGQWKTQIPALFKNIAARQTSITKTTPLLPGGGTPHDYYGDAATDTAPAPSGAPEPSKAPSSGGVVSGSGKYRWDGTQWVPNQ